MPIPSGKTMQCRDCLQILSIEKFSRAGRKDGFRRPECRKCQHLRNKKINPNYQWTKGTVSARETHKLGRVERDFLVKKKLPEQGNECVYCNSKVTVENSNLDHIVLLARGGRDTEGNYQVLCERCNKEKHSKTHEEYISWLFEIGETKKKSRLKLKKYF